MPLNKEQWAAAKLALPIFEKMLEQKGCRLAATEGNRFRLAERLQEISNVPVDPNKIATLLYGIVLADTNKVVNQPGYESQFFWQVKPPKLVAFERNTIRNTIGSPTHLPDKQKKVSPEAQQEAKQEIERLCARSGFMETGPHAITIHRFVQEHIESGADLARAIPMVKKFLAADLKKAMQILNEYLAGGTFDYTGGSFYSGQGFSSGGSVR